MFRYPLRVDIQTSTECNQLKTPGIHEVLPLDC